MTGHLPSEQEVLNTDLSYFTFYNFYAQKVDGKPETWTQAVGRAVDALRYLSNNELTDAEYQDIFDGIYQLKVLPSMRLFSMPLDAIRRCNTVIYNCSFVAIDDFDTIAEMLYLSMSGVGIGYSVENKVISKLPEIPYFYYNTAKTKFVVPDAQDGWADSIKYLFKSVLNGEYPVFDYSQIRSAGEPLKTKGGYASGPDPLSLYHRHALFILAQAQGRQLTSLEVHDIVNMISECAISNGSRTGALICLFDHDDEAMFDAKSDPEWYIKTPWRAYSNNSMVVNGDTGYIDTAIQKLIYDQTGEPGLFSPQKFFDSGRTTKDYVGVNPCGEVLLRHKEFCNLSTIVLDEHAATDQDELFRRAELATLIGTIQSMADNFNYLSSDWKVNSQEERLLGVCVTGIYDYKDNFSKDSLTSLMNYIKVVNAELASKFGINVSASVTSVKPSGNTSVLTNTSPGVNPDFSKYQIRNIRVGKHSKMAEFLINNGVPYILDPYDSNQSKYVFSFPKISRSENTIDKTTAKEQIENYLMWKDYYTTHNVSVTITYKNDEKDYIAQWIKDNYRTVVGAAFFPYYESNQAYLPVQVVSENDYLAFVEKYPVINWQEYADFAAGNHVSVPVLECSGERCDIVWQ